MSEQFQSANRPRLFLVRSLDVLRSVYVREVSWNASKSMWRRYFTRDGICIFFLKCPKIQHIQFRWFSHFKIDHAFFLEMTHFLLFVFPEMPHFSYLILKMGKWGISGKTNRKKWGISRKKHVIDLKTRKEPKMNMFDFGAFQEKLHMLSREKYLLHMLFGAFHDTPCNIIPYRSRSYNSITWLP